MRLARVIGNVTLGQRHPSMPLGRLLIAEALDPEALAGLGEHAPRSKPMPESLVVYDELGAGVGQMIAVSEGAEAAAPFWPDKVPLDAYCAALLDAIDVVAEK